VLWDICRQAMSQPVVTLMGTGTESRDFIHADDVARGIGAVIDGGDFNAGVYNLATGVETTIRDLARMLLAAIGRTATVEFSGLARQGDPTSWRADIGRLSALGYVPKVSIAEGAAAYARWVLSSHGSTT
jgi:UDP-glucose 4-epimerase